MKLTLLGTGDCAMIPVYGCDCKVCSAAHSTDITLKRGKSSASLSYQGRTLLIDANLADLAQRFPAGTIDAILITHYHMDHVHSLFDLRWGSGKPIPVISPDDPIGCDDLYKHAGILDFSQRAKPFESFEWQGISITPLPLNHSRLCVGYCFELDGKRVAYLTDTVGLPEETQTWLEAHPVNWMVIDCTYPPPNKNEQKKPRNHNSFDQILQIDTLCQPQNIGLTHLSHQMVEWAQDNQRTFSPRLRLLKDNEEIEL